MAVAMLPTSVSTSSASATTVTTAGLPCTLHQVHKTTAVLSKKSETVQGLSKIILIKVFSFHGFVLDSFSWPYPLTKDL